MNSKFIKLNEEDKHLHCTTIESEKTDKAGNKLKTANVISEFIIIRIIKNIIWIGNIPPFVINCKSLNVKISLILRRKFSFINFEFIDDNKKNILSEADVQIRIFNNRIKYNKNIIKYLLEDKDILGSRYN